MLHSLRLYLFVWVLLGGSIGACVATGQSGGEAGQPDSSTPFGSTDAGHGEGDGTVFDSNSGSETSTSNDAPGGPEADTSVDTRSPSLSDSGTDSPDVADAGTLRFTCPAGPFTAPTLTGLMPTKVAGVPPSDSFNNTNKSFGIIEGPVWVGDSLYVSEIGESPSGQNPPPSRILRVTSAGAVSIAIADSGSNGLAVDKDDNLYGAVHTSGSIERFDLSTGVATPIATEYMGSRFDSPNDLAIRSDGNIYFSDPDDQAPTPRPQMQTRLYRVASGTSAVSVIDATLSEPNGVTLSLDENTLYVTSTHGLFKYPVMTDGSVGAGTLVTSSLNGDGMAIDCAGDLYVASIDSPNIVVLSPSGTQIGEISVPSGSVQGVTNVAFGGADHKTLYITALGTGPLKGLFQVSMSIPGMPY